MNKGIEGVEMELIKKITVLSAVLAFGVLPSFAGFNGKISRGHFYDTEKTIMVEVPFNKTLTTAKYWDKNNFYFNKYRPLYMLSNKELYDFMPKEKVSIVQRISTPTVYNISFKSASIKEVSFDKPYSLKAADAPIVLKGPIKEIINPTQNKKIADVRIKPSVQKMENPDDDIDKKIEMAQKLKDSHNHYNYSLALDLLDEVTREEPFNAYAFYLKGELYLAQKDSANAMKNYLKALKINPTGKQCCLGIAKILEPTNKELSQKYYQKAKSL